MLVFLSGPTLQGGGKQNFAKISKIRSKAKSLGTITVIGLGRHLIVAGVIHPTVDTTAAVVTLLQAVDTALIVTMVDTVVVRPFEIITMKIGTMVVIGPLLAAEVADRPPMIINLLEEEDMAILTALLLRAVIRRTHIRRTGILAAGLGDLLRGAMDTNRLGVTGDFLLLMFCDSRIVAVVNSAANISGGVIGL